MAIRKRHTMSATILLCQLYLVFVINITAIYLILWII